MHIRNVLRRPLALLSLVWIATGAVAFTSSTVSLDVPDRADATPWVAASGSFVAVVWGATGAGKTDVYLAVSRDGGFTFSAPIQVNAAAGEARLGGELPPRVALVPRRGSGVPEIVVLWTARADTTSIKVARSRDGGRSFDAPMALQSSGAAGDRGWPAVALDDRATIHAVWLDHRGMASNRTGNKGHTSHKHASEHDGVAMAQKSGLFYGSADAKTSQERQLTNGVCYCCKTALAAGPNGTLYAAWRHVYSGNLRDMAFTVSRDGGRTFQPPSRVSEDGWSIDGCPDDGPAIAVDGRGDVHLAWPTVVNGTTLEGAIFYASTRDGQRFTPRLRVPTLGGPKPSHPHIAVDRRGRVFIAWDESINGRRVAALRELQRHRNAQPTFGDVVTLSQNGPAIYPALAATDKGLVAVWTASGDSSRIETRMVPTP